MRIILFTHAISRHADDHPQFINELALAYQRAGHCVRIITASHCTIDPERLDPRLDIQRYRYAPKRWERLGYGDSLDSDLMLDNIAYLLAPMLLFAGCWALWRAITNFHPDFVHVHWALPNGPMAALATLPTRTPFIISFPGSDVTVMGANPLLTSIGRFACRRATLLTTNSHDLRDAVINFGISKNNFHFVLYGSDSTTAQPDQQLITSIRKQFSLDNKRPIILAIGRMVPKKGFRYLIEAASILAQRGYDFQVIFIGDGPLKHTLQQQCQQRSLGDKIRFVGKIPYSQLPQWYALANLFAMPAIRDPVDGLNVVVTEAMKFALPIIASDVGGNELVIDHEKNGLLCPQCDPHAFADALQRCLDHPDDAARMGCQAHATFLSRASWESIVDRYLTFITPHLRPPFNQGE